MDDILTTRRIGHSEAQEIAQRLINSRFGHEPGVRISVPLGRIMTMTC